MDKLFGQKTGSTQKLKTSKPRLRFIKERDDLDGRAVPGNREPYEGARSSELANVGANASGELRTAEDIERWAELVVSDNNSKRLVVKASRWIHAISALILVICGVVFFIVASQVKDEALMFSGMGTLVLLLSTLYVGLLFRRRPLYEVNERGIVDHGLMSLGFGLIEWRNIQSVRTFEQRGSTSLLVKVDNYNELLERRNLLIRPYLWLSGMLSAMLGGEITLTITLGNASQSAILECISYFSRRSGRDVVAPKRGFLKEAAARAVLIGFLLVMFSFFGLFGLELYKHWLPHMSPKLETLDAGFPSQVPVNKKSAWIDDVIVQNFGGDSRGIKIELSGSSFDTGLLKQPKVLVQYDEKPEDLQHVRLRTRELLTLREEKKNFWTATSATANMPHKDNTFMDTVKFLAPNGQSMLKQDIGFWTDTTSPNLLVEIFADTVKKGSGSVTLKVIPLANPSKAVSQTLQVKSDKISIYDMPLYSVSIPKDYPISLYPGGQIMWVSGNDLKFDSEARPEQIALYYEKDLHQRGWKTSSWKEQSNIGLTANKGEARMSIRIYHLPGHSPVEMSYSAW